MPIRVKQRIYASLLSPAPQNPALSGYAIYGDVNRNTLIFDNVSGRGWFTHLNSSSNDVACLLGPIACTTHISTALSRVYWREEAEAITNEAVLVLDRENLFGKFKVQVPTTFTEPTTFSSSVTTSSLAGSYLLGAAYITGTLESRSLESSQATIGTGVISVTSGWVNATNTINVGTSGLTTTWLVLGHATVGSNTNHDDLGIRIYNSSTSAYLASSTLHIEHAGTYHPVHLSGIVTVTDIDTLALQVTSTNNDGLISTAPNGAGSRGVSLTAIRIG